MRVFANLSSVLLSSALSVAASAASYTATPANFAAVFDAAQPGDLITLSGNFGAVTLADKSFAVPLRIDASAATFSDTLLIKNVTGVSFNGGYFGSTTRATRYAAAVAAYADSNISFTKAYMVGAQTGTGIAYIGGTGLTVTASTFDGLRSGVDFGSSAGATLTHNVSTNSASDGFDVANSHFVSITSSTCSNGLPSAGAHPDCVQLYSLPGNPVQSDITIANNVARGPTQGFSSFDPMYGGALRVDISNNVVATSYPDGISCYACVDSVFTGNTLTTLPGARYRTTLNVIGGADNLIFGNTEDGAYAPNQTDPASTGDLASAFATELGWTDASFLGAVTSALPGDTILTTKGATVPEPSGWALMLAGFGAVGAALRRRAAWVVVA